MKNKVIKILVLLTLVVTCFCLGIGCSCNGDNGEDDVKVAIELSVTSQTMRTFDTYQIIANANVPGEISWESNNPTVATVDDNGLVTALTLGDAVIQVELVENETKKSVTKKCYITVIAENREPVLRVDNVETDNKLTLGKNDFYSLKSNIYFDGERVEGQFSFKSLDETIATVNKIGEITTKDKSGSTVIEISALYRDFTLQTTVTVEVLKGAYISVAFDSDERLYGMSNYGGKSYKNSVGYSVTLKTETEVVSTGFSVESKNPNIAVVKGNKIIAKGAGRAEIAFKIDNDGQTHEKSVFVDVAYIEVDNSNDTPKTFERKKDISLNAFSAYTASTQITSVWDISTDVKSEISVLGNEFVNLPVGDKTVHIYSTVLSVKQSLHVIDHYITTTAQFKSILPNATTDYIELGADIIGVGAYKFNSGVIFSGVLDGNGHTVYDISFSNNNALFSTLRGTVKNIAFKDVNLSNTAATLFSQSNGGKVDNVCIEVLNATSDKVNNRPVGGIGIQFDGPISISNTVVVMGGIKDTNAGAVAGVWWGNTPTITNSYFITDGTPYGISLGSKGNNEFGAIENEKGSWDYIYSSEKSFVTEQNKLDSKINLSEFKTEIWDMSGDLPTFYNLLKELNGNLYNGELYYFDKGTTDENYNVVLPEDIGTPLSVSVGDAFIENCSFDSGTMTLTIPTAAFKDLTCGDYVMSISANAIYTAKVTVADYVVTDADSLARAFSDLNGRYIVLAADVSGATVNAGAGNYTGVTFDGKGFILTNLTVSGDSKAMFGQMLSSSKIKNVAFVNLTNNGKYALLAQVANRNTVFENVFLSGISMKDEKLFVEMNNTVKLNNCIFSYSNSSGYMSKVAMGSAVSTNVIFDDGNFFMTYEQGLPTDFEGDFELIDNALKFNGVEVLKKPLEGAYMAGTLYNEELYYFDKSTTEENYVITLPQDVGNVTEINIGTTPITGFDYQSGTMTLSIPSAQIKELSSGDTQMYIVGNAIYETKITIADYVATDAASLATAFSNLNGKYIVLGADISGATINSGTGARSGVTFDGKGFTVSNTTVNGRAIFGESITDSAIKNVAFVNITNNSSQGTLAQDSNRVTYENVFVSGSGSHENKPVIFKETNSNTKLTNCIFSVQNADGFVTAYSKTGTPTATNTVFDNGLNFFSVNNSTNVNFGDFGFDADGNLTFNGTIVLDKYLETVALDGTLYNKELYHFDKSTTDLNYSISLPEDIGTVTAVKVGETDITNYSYNDKVLTIPVSKINGITCGDTTMTITANKIYGASVTVADYVIKDATTFKTIMSNTNGANRGKYIILGADIDNATVNNVWNSGVQSELPVKFDGKGFVVSNLTIDGRAIFGNTLGNGSVIKNVAFVNAKNADSGCRQAILAGNVSNVTFENVFMSAENNRAGNKGIITASSGSTKVNNCIFSVKVGGEYVSTAGPTNVTNVLLDSGNFLTTYAGGLPTSFGGDFAINASGNLTFNGKEVLTK